MYSTLASFPNFQGLVNTSFPLQLFRLNTTPLSLDIRYSLNLLDMIRHPRDAQCLAKLSPLPSASLLDGLLQVSAILIAVRLLDLDHVCVVPVIAHQARDEQLLA